MTDISFADSIDRLKESFLWAAAQGGNAQDCAALIDIGADINWRNNDGETPLLAACKRGHTETISILLALGADPNICGNDSLAPIHVCAKRGDGSSMDVLLDSASTVTAAKTKNGQSALDIAKEKGYEQIYSRLMRQRRPLSRQQTQLAQQPQERPLTDRPLISTRGELPALSSIPPSSSQPTTSNTRRKQAVDRVMEHVSKEISNDLVGVGSSTTNLNNRNHTVTTSANNNTNITNSNTNTGPSTAGGYSIITQNQPPGYVYGTPTNGAGLSEEQQQIIALRKVLEHEREDKKLFESKLQIFMKQNKELLNELTNLHKSHQELQQSVTRIQSQNYQYTGEFQKLEKTSYAITTIQQYEQLEKVLKKTLSIIEEKKTVMIRSQIESSKEQRLCVICQEFEKSVVLLPCRHMCLCETCAEHDEVDLCPLCREQIAHKISVFS